jgi:hypothetical protein
MAAIAKIKRELYMKGSEERGAAWIGARYVGQGLRREETLFYERYSDWPEGHRIRLSEDNGRTWSDWKLQHEEYPSQGGFSKEEVTFARCYDPLNDKHIQFVFQRILIGKGNEAVERFFQTGEETMFDHNFYQISDDDERTWGELHQLCYEEGGVYDLENWGKKEYLLTNKMYGGYSAVATRQGKIVYPSCGVPFNITDRGKKEAVKGILCFIGRWNPREKNYDLELSEQIYVPNRVAWGGLEEPVIAELSDGRLLLVMRGSTHVPKWSRWKGEVENGGHKWMSVSQNSGRTWSPVTDLRYDTGEQFYSPGSQSMLLRHSLTGKLYWFGNISPTPTHGNDPRYPLYIAEVDESIPALKKATLTVIDDRNPEKDTDNLSLSNFSVFENRETGEMELYLTRYNERANVFAADAYKYTITLRE